MIRSSRGVGEEAYPLSSSDRLLLSGYQPDFFHVNRTVPPAARPHRSGVVFTYET